MADLYGTHFEYDGVSSRLYGLITANVKTKRFMELSGERDDVTIYNRGSQKRYWISNKFDRAPLSFDIEFLKEDLEAIQKEDRRIIERWLFNRNGYFKFYLDKDDDIKGDTYEYIDGKLYRTFLLCRFVNPEKIEADCGVIGYKATLEADSLMLWQDPITINISGAELTSKDIVVDSDLNEYIYPKVTIVVGSTGGNISIVNISDGNRETAFINTTANATIVMNGETNRIKGIGFDKFSGRNFLRLMNGSNSIVCNGDISSVSIEYSARRYL